VSFIHNAFAVIRKHLLTFIVFNIGFNGLFVITMIITATRPQMQEIALAGVKEELNQPGLGSAVSAGYDSGNVLWAAGITLFVNLFVAALLTTTVPSLILLLVGAVYEAIEVIYIVPRAL
jgi:hypothetical protein